MLAMLPASADRLRAPRRVAAAVVVSQEDEHTFAGTGNQMSDTARYSR